MRVTSYPTLGKPSTGSKILNQLVMLLQASLVLADTERYALEPAQGEAPDVIKALTAKHSAYEVTVVDQFHRIARSHFARAGQFAYWERAFQTGKKGRPRAVDITIFDPAAASEIRLELGSYDLPKLQIDVAKLHKLSTKGGGVVAGFANLANFVALWEVRPGQVRKTKTAKNALARYRVAAAGLTTKAGGAYAVKAILASAVDLYSATDGAGSHAVFGVFEVI